LSICERKKELKRRRHRKKKLTVLIRKLQKATASERGIIAEKIRNLSPGAEEIIKRLGIAER